jgi:hypothetical protein
MHPYLARVQCRSWDCLCEECAGQIGVTCRRKNNPQNQWTVYTFTDHTCDHVARSKVSSYNGKYGPTKRSCVSTKVVTDKVSEHFTVPLMVSTKARALKDATKEKLGVDVPLRQAYRIKQETRARATFDTDYQLLWLAMSLPGTSKTPLALRARAHARSAPSFPVTRRATILFVLGY